MCALPLKLTGIGAVRLLFRIVGQLAHQAARTRKVEHDQLLGHLRSEHGKLPGDGTAPIVADDDRLLFSTRLNDGGDIINQDLHVVVLPGGQPSHSGERPMDTNPHVFAVLCFSPAFRRSNDDARNSGPPMRGSPGHPGAAKAHPGSFCRLSGGCVGLLLPGVVCFEPRFHG